MENVHVRQQREGWFLLLIRPLGPDKHGTLDRPLAQVKKAIAVHSVQEHAFKFSKDLHVTKIEIEIK